MQTQSKNRKGDKNSTVIKGIINTPTPQFGQIQTNKGFFKPNSRFQSINRGRR